MSLPKNKDGINRREFISRTGMIAIASSMPGFVSCDAENPNKLQGKDCHTTADILGPFYKAGAPFRVDIIPSDDTNAPLIVRGKVFGDCDTELEDSVVEIWNANAVGEYDNATFGFRGRHKTGSDGVYVFKTIVPGRYLNGGEFRPSHIHFRITAPDYQELVSQIYFKDDPFIAGDPWAGDPRASERILATGKDENDTDTITFDIYLKRFV